MAMYIYGSYICCHKEWWSTGLLVDDAGGLRNKQDSRGGEESRVLGAKTEFRVQQQKWPGNQLT
jgi:hypothetical protein